MIAGTRCLVTGGAGTIGSTIVDQLAAAGADEIVVLDNFVRGRPENLASALRSGKVRVVDGDIRDQDLLRSLMPGIDLVFHQAAIRITQCATEPRLAVQVLVDGTYEVVEAAVDAGVRKVIAASSASVYGLAETFPTTERQHPYANDTLYGVAKTFNEGLLRSFHAMRGLDYVALRYFNVYGPRMDIYGLYTEVLIRWMERIEAGRPPVILGDGLQTMDFVFTEDIARANLLAATADVTDEVVNIGSGTETSLVELAEALQRAMGSVQPLEFGPPRGVNGVTRRLADISRARQSLGWKPEIGLDEGLRRLVTWWRAQRAGGSEAGARMIPVMRPWLGREEAEAAAATVASGWIAQGPRVQEFEAAFAAAIGTPHAVAVSSCTTALHLTLIAAGIGPGDEVIVPSLSFIATANAVRYVGAQPVFADVDRVTQNLVPETVQPRLTGRTRAVILVDQAGVPADLATMRALCDPLQVTVIEDAACAAGSSYRGRPVGAGAELAAFSFHPRKLLTTGEGGMITTGDEAVAARLRRLREHGMDVSAADRHRSRQPVIEHYTEVGFNYRMTDIQAAIGLVQLRKLAPMVARRRLLARRYTESAVRYPGSGRRRVTRRTARPTTSRSGCCSPRSPRSAGMS